MSRVEEIREVVETVVNGEHNNVYRNLCKAMKAYSCLLYTSYITNVWQSKYAYILDICTLLCYNR